MSQHQLPLFNFVKKLEALDALPFRRRQDAREEREQVVRLGEIPSRLLTPCHLLSARSCDIRS
eukprot:6197501-Pleurochrysis_carterae.AAC.1